MYQNKVNLNLTFSQRLGHQAHNCKMATTVKWPCVLDCKPPGGYYWEFLVEVCHPVLQNLTRFKTKKLLFSTSVFRLDFSNPFPFSDLAFMLSLPTSRLERKQKRYSIHFEFAYFSFFLTNLELKR